jgi:hypothetical protein
MNDELLEARLRRLYRAEVGRDEAAPAGLRAQVAAIPRSTPDRSSGRRRTLLMLGVAAAVTTAVIGAALGVGTGARRSVSIAPVVSPPTSSEPTRPPGVIAVLHHISPLRDPELHEDNNSEGELWVLDANASTGHPLLGHREAGAVGITWSTDGSHLVFSEAGRLYQTDASGTSPQPVDTHCEAPCQGDRYPAYSRDGTKLVFDRTISKVPLSAPGAPARSVLATLDLTTGRVTELASTTISHDKDGHGPYGITYQQSGWSPDGRQIAFTRWNMVYDGAGVFIVNADGTDLRELDTSGIDARGPHWSPDGATIVFSSIIRQQAAPRTSNVQLDIYSIRPDGTELRRLTDDGVSSGATWTVDGRIAFTKVPGGNKTPGEPLAPEPLSAEVWVMDADGSRAAALGNLPDAQRLIFPEDVAIQP